MFRHKQCPAWIRTVRAVVSDDGPVFAVLLLALVLWCVRAAEFRSWRIGAGLRKRCRGQRAAEEEVVVERGFTVPAVVCLPFPPDSIFMVRKRITLWPLNRHERRLSG